jgi:hypothetical protein
MIYDLSLHQTSVVNVNLGGFFPVGRSPTVNSPAKNISLASMESQISSDPQLCKISWESTLKLQSPISLFRSPVEMFMLNPNGIDDARDLPVWGLACRHTAD